MFGYIVMNKPEIKMKYVYYYHNANNAELDARYPDLNDDCFKILLTHNPMHWDEEVISGTNIENISGTYIPKR